MTFPSLQLPLTVPGAYVPLFWRKKEHLLSHPGPWPNRVLRLRYADYRQLKALQLNTM